MLLLISRLISGEAGLFLARMRRIAVLYAVAAILALATAGFFLAALFILLAEQIGSLAAALIFAAVCFLLLVVTCIILLSARRPSPRRAGERMQRDIASVAGAAAWSNAPLLLYSLRRRKSLVLVPTAALGIWALWRILAAFRNR